MKKHLPYILAIMVVAVWGETFVSSKVLLTAGLMPADIFFFRFLIAYVCLALFSHKKLWADSWKHELLFVALGIFGGSLYFLTENMALRYSTASNVAILVGTVPLVTAILLAAFYKDERMDRRQVLGSVIAFVGLIMVVLNGQLVLHLNPLGDALALAAACTWGFYSLIMKTVNKHYDTMFITRKVFAYGILTILPWFAFVEPLQTDMAILSQPKVWINIVYLGLVASLICFISWNWVLSRIGIVKATNILYSQCAFTMFFSVLVLHDNVTFMAIAGTATLIYGMVLIARKKQEPGN